MTLAVSVCIPAYKQPEVLLRTVNSVLMQQGCVFEIIITDDSDDDQVEISLASVLPDSRIRYYKNQSRLGAIGNWNYSIKLARNSVIKILHHDDWFVTDDALLKSVEPILLGSALVVFSACEAVNTNGNNLFTHIANKSQLVNLREHPQSLVFTNFIGPPSVVAFKKELNVFFDKKYIWLSDVDFYIRLLAAAKGDFFYITSPLVNVTAESKDQLSRECESQRLRSLIENIDLFSQQETIFRYEKLVSHFYSLASGLKLKEILTAVWYSFKLYEFKIFSILSIRFVVLVLSGKK